MSISSLAMPPAQPKINEPLPNAAPESPTAGAAPKLQEDTALGVLSSPRAVKTADRRTVWGEQGEPLEVTVPKPFSSVKAFDLNEMEGLQPDPKTPPSILGGDDAGRYLLLARMRNNASFPRQGKLAVSTTAADYASTLQEQLAARHTSRAIRDGVPSLKDLRREIDATLKRSFDLIRQPALTREEFESRFGEITSDPVRNLSPSPFEPGYRFQWKPRGGH